MVCNRRIHHIYLRRVNKLILIRKNQHEENQNLKDVHRNDIFQNFDSMFFVQEGDDDLDVGDLI